MTDFLNKVFPAPRLHDTEALVVKDILDRQLMGLNKYGVSVANNPLELHEWLTHAYEETLDKAIYLKRCLQELERMGVK